MSVAYDKFDLTGRTAVVTGGCRGLGYYMARGLARSGATVMITARTEADLKQAAEALSAESDGREVFYHSTDLSLPADTAAMAGHALQRMGRVDILVGNAGQANFQPVDGLTDDSVDHTMNLNFRSNMSLLRAFLPGMRERKWGRAIFSSSLMAVNTGDEGTSAYSASKGALDAFVRAAAMETGRDGITVNSLIIGMFYTDQIRRILTEVEAAGGAAAKEAFNDILTSMIPMRRQGRPEEIEGIVQLLASEAGSYINAANLVIDGGFTVALHPLTPL